MCVAHRTTIPAQPSPLPTTYRPHGQDQGIRRKVIEICEAALKAAKSPEDEFWIRATMAEAWTGLGDRARSREILDTTRKNAPAQWMVDSAVEQLSKLEKLIVDSPLR